MKAKKAALLYDVASDYNKGIAEFFKKTFEENGGTVVAFETYTTNDNIEARAISLAQVQ